MDNNEFLHLDFKKNNNVVFNRGKLLDANHWRELLVYWKKSEIQVDDCTTFNVNISTFYDQRQWFYSNWKSKGRKVFVSENLKKALIKRKDFCNEFSNALNATIPSNLNKINLSNLKRSLTKEQEVNVSCSIAIKNGANFSVPGAGKTTATLAIWNHFFQEKSINKLLVVCPLSVIETWLEDEIPETFHIPPLACKVSTLPIDKNVEVLLVNYEKLEQNYILNKLINWANDNNVMMVLDEAHRVKGGGHSVRWNFCKQLADCCKRVELLTGTPMPQGYSDLRNLFTLSWGNLPSSLVSDNALANLNPGGLFVRTTKDQLKLRPPVIREIVCEPSEVQYDIYTALKKNYAGIFKMDEGSERFLGKKGSAVMTLIAAATNPGLILGRELESSYLDFTWPPKEISKNTEIIDLIKEYSKYQKPPPKYSWVLKFIKEQSKLGKKTLIWSNFVGNIISLNRLLRKQNHSPAVVHGGVNGELRRKEIERFKADPACHALITNPQTLGEGISLHKVCNQSVYLDRTFNLVHYLQSLDRIHRLGLDKDTVTNIYVLTTANTIDNRIDSRLKVKIDRMAESLNDNSLVKSSDVIYDDNERLLDLKLDNLDLEELFNHLNNE